MLQRGVSAPTGLAGGAGGGSAGSADERRAAPATRDQIQAFRTFSISPELQETHGYPELTDEVRSKILWRNGAALYRIDPATLPRQPDPAEADAARRSSARAHRTYGPRTAAGARRLFLTEHP